MIVGINRVFQINQFLYSESFYLGGIERAVRFSEWNFIKRGGKSKLYNLWTYLGVTIKVADWRPDIVNSIVEDLKTAKTTLPYLPLEIDK